MNRAVLVLLAAAAAATAGAAEKPRVYITESRVTEIAADDIRVQKGTTPENIEVMKAFLKLCPQLIVTGSRNKADYVIRFDRDSPSPATPFVKGNKVAVFDQHDDLVYGDSARYLANAVKGACAATLKHAASAH